MRFVHAVTKATVAALCALGATGVPAPADQQSGFYLAYRPGAFVRYISLVRSGNDVTGFFEDIRASATSPDGETRTQTFAKRVGETLSFGTSIATRLGNGYVLTSIVADGRIVQLHLVPASVSAVNGAVSALADSVRHGRPAGSDVATGPAGGDDAARERRAQTSLEAATAQLAAAEQMVDRLSAVARKARADANAEIDKPGVSFEQNQSRIAAMKTADDAEQNVIAAQRSAATAQSAVVAAREEVDRLQKRIAVRAERARTLGAGTPDDDGMGP